MDSTFEELREENDKTKEKISKLSGENGKLNGQINEMKGEITEMKNEMGQLKEENKKLKDGSNKIYNENDKLKGQMMEMQAKIDEMSAKFDEKIVELKTENSKINKEMNAKLDANKLGLANLIENHKINAQQIPFKFDSAELKKNKMDLADCAPKLGFSKNALHVTSNGDGWRCVRANLDVPKFNPNAKETYIVFYFEGHIKKTSTSGGGVGMGFCSYQFPLEGNYIGKQQNSIGFLSKHGVLYCGKEEIFQEEKEHFIDGDKIGFGLMYEPKNASIKCFGICKHKLLGCVELSAKFFDVKIFPVVGLKEAGNSIQLNFGAEAWDYDPRQIIQLIK